VGGIKLEEEIAIEECRNRPLLEQGHTISWFQPFEPSTLIEEQSSTAIETLPCPHTVEWGDRLQPPRWPLTKRFFQPQGKIREFAICLQLMDQHVTKFVTPGRDIHAKGCHGDNDSLHLVRGRGIRMKAQSKNTLLAEVSCPVALAGCKEMDGEGPQRIAHLLFELVQMGDKSGRLGPKVPEPANALIQLVAATFLDCLIYIQVESQRGISS